MKEMNMPFEFPERLWRRPIEVHDGKPRPRVAASSYEKPISYSTFDDGTSLENEEARRPSSSGNSRIPRPQDDFGTDPQVKVHTEAGNAKVIVELGDIQKEELTLNCAEDSLTLSVKTSTGLWRKEIAFPFHVDPDTAKAVFRNGRLELVVRKHGRFNPPGPKIDWV